MEDINEYESPDLPPARVKPLDDPDFLGAEAAFKRAGAKALALAKAAGLEPVIIKKDHS
ncbi:MAG: hypothetical protein HKP20_01370, partial [Akkermansiaceae bacterium]|nr:hypothetical protein [Akkermansiaceae bacterium]